MGAVPGVVCWKFVSTVESRWEYSGDAQLIEGVGVKSNVEGFVLDQILPLFLLRYK